MDHPVRLIITDDLRRNRLTVLFRLILVIPHVIVLVLWGIAAYIVGIINWFATLIKGESPQGLHDFLAGFLRYSTQVNAYCFLLADPYPAFGGADGYPVDLQVAPPERQNRWTVFFRGILVIPAYILASVLNYLLELLAFLGWFAALFTGKMPEGLRNLGAFCLRYQQQTYAYMFLVTPRYPSLSTGETTAPAPSTPSGA
jgi:hypothetical protein